MMDETALSRLPERIAAMVRITAMVPTAAKVAAVPSAFPPRAMVAEATRMEVPAVPGAAASPMVMR